MGSELSVWPALLALAAVVAAIPATAWLLGRVPALRALRGRGDGALAMVATLPLGARERVAIVRAGDRWLVVGVTAAGVSLLTTLDAPPPGAPGTEGGDVADAADGARGARGANGAQAADRGAPVTGTLPAGSLPASFAAQLERVLGAVRARRDAARPPRRSDGDADR